MWTNSLLKKNAWEKLKGYYWSALGVVLLSSILGADSGGSFLGGGGSSYSRQQTGSEGTSSDISPEQALMFLLVAMIIMLIAWGFVFVFKTLLGNPVKCGECKYFCAARNGDPNFSHLFDNFKNGSYMPTVKTMFFKDLYVFLWSLLFVIPGIIKTYEYFLIPYLLAENPRLSRQRAFEISKKTMDGEKFKLFVLGLSFIGWYLLGYLACCIGTIFVTPYQTATYAEFYMCMRAKMLSYGYTTEDELCGEVADGSFFGGTPYGGSGDAFYGSNNYGDTTYGNNSYGDPYNNSSNSYDPYNTNSYNNGSPYNNDSPYRKNDDDDPNNPYNS